jgi:hypothetical protein
LVSDYKALKSIAKRLQSAKIDCEAITKREATAKRLQSVKQFLSDYKARSDIEAITKSEAIAK